MGEKYDPIHLSKILPWLLCKGEMNTCGEAVQGPCRGQGEDGGLGRWSYL